jgi:hypothetical protein
MRRENMMYCREGEAGTKATSTARAYSSVEYVLCRNKINRSGKERKGRGGRRRGKEALKSV